MLSFHQSFIIRSDKWTRHAAAISTLNRLNRFRSQDTVSDFQRPECFFINYSSANRKVVPNTLVMTHYFDQSLLMRWLIFLLSLILPFDDLPFNMSHMNMVRKQGFYAVYLKTSTLRIQSI